jgi:hypothetical protein
MKIKITTYLSGAVTYRPGDIVELAPRHAQRLIARGHASAVSASNPAAQPIETTAAYEVDEVRPATPARKPRAARTRRT